jgi:outer membrane immunogenic protein
MFRSLAAALGLLVSLTSQASAQSPDGLWRWTVFYIGAGVGGGGVLQTQTDTFFPASETTGAGGALATLTAGYDVRINQNFVAGVFIDADVSNMSNPNFGMMSLPFEHRHSLSIGGRLGFLATPATLWYVAAGYTRANFTFAILGDFDFDGVFFGAGVETRLTGNWSLRGEYRYTQFAPEQLLDLCGCGSFDAEASMHTGRVVLVYALGAAGQ